MRNNSEPDTSYPIIFTTSRLQCRKMDLSHLSTFIAYRNEPEVARYQSWEPNLTEEYGREFIQNLAIHPVGSLDEWNQLALELKADGTHVGDLALHVSAEGDQAEIGYTLAQKYQGQGLMREAVVGFLDFLFTTLKLHRITATTDCSNSASVNLLEKIGMRREGHFHENIWFKGAWGDEYLYAILAKEWKKKI